MDEQLTAIKARGGEVNEALAEQLTGMFAIDLASFNGDTGAANAYVDGMVQAVACLLYTSSTPKRAVWPPPA